MTNRRQVIADPMMVAFTFQAKAGREKEFEALLNDDAMGLAVAKALGAKRNTLFLSGGRMVRVFEFADDATPVPLREAALADENIADFLRKLGPLIEGGFDYDEPATLDAFNARVRMPLAYDVHVRE